MSFVDIGHGGSMATLNVIGEDLQLGFCEELSLVGEQQRVAGHAGIGLLGPWRDLDPALENAARFIEDDASHRLCRRRADRLMFEGHRHVSVAVATQEIDAAQVQLRTFTRLSTMQLPPDKLAASIRDEQLEPRILLENEVQMAEMTVGGPFRLD